LWLNVDGHAPVNTDAFKGQFRVLNVPLKVFKEGIKEASVKTGSAAPLGLMG
jgi:hypothetical protein